jgi:hypothetical protein
MTDREALLDELARCYARAAVDAFLEQGRNTTPQNGDATAVTTPGGVYQQYERGDSPHAHAEPTGPATPQQ